MATTSPPLKERDSARQRPAVAVGVVATTNRPLKERDKHVLGHATVDLDVATTNPPLKVRGAASVFCALSERADVALARVGAEG